MAEYTAGQQYSLLAGSRFTVQVFFMIKKIKLTVNYMIQCMNLMGTISVLFW